MNHLNSAVVQAAQSPNPSHDFVMSSAGQGVTWVVIGGALGVIAYLLFFKSRNKG